MGETMYHHYDFAKKSAIQALTVKVYHIYFVFSAIVNFRQAKGICCVIYPVYFGIDSHWQSKRSRG